MMWCNRRISSARSGSYPSGLFGLGISSVLYTAAAVSGSASAAAGTSAGLGVGVSGEILTGATAGASIFLTSFLKPFFFLSD